MGTRHPRSTTAVLARNQPAGEALVAEDGTWLVWAESGHGSPDVHADVKRVLAEAWRLDQALDDRDGAVTMAAHLLEANESLQARLDEAKAWARWAYAITRHAGSLPMPAGKPPDWLTEPDEHL